MERERTRRTTITQEVLECWSWPEKRRNRLLSDGGAPLLTVTVLGIGRGTLRLGYLHPWPSTIANDVDPVLRGEESHKRKAALGKDDCGRPVRRVSRIGTRADGVGAGHRRQPNRDDGVSDDGLELRPIRRRDDSTPAEKRQIVKAPTKPLNAAMYNCCHKINCAIIIVSLSRLTAVDDWQWPCPIYRKWLQTLVVGGRNHRGIRSRINHLPV
jgi:hypothetical protein